MYPYFMNQPFGFFPFPFGGRRRRLRTITGIPVLRTTGVSATTTQVRYDVNQSDFCALPIEGLFFLEVAQSSATADAALPVGLTNNTSTDEPALTNALSESVQAGDLLINNRYLIYYNKRTNTYQLVNAYPAAITA